MSSIAYRDKLSSTADGADAVVANFEEAKVDSCGTGIEMELPVRLVFLVVCGNALFSGRTVFATDGNFPFLFPCSRGCFGSLLGRLVSSVDVKKNLVFFCEVLDCIEFLLADSITTNTASPKTKPSSF